ncbi:385_t:CDS:2 [Scutellospora calospora]|uniref:385_t:CDS:1 n=1 Tax=Scutellospora calospora TaxID=85575 RepID=A0ACA9KYU0_9GLOM|nr:385_t:CDS:2 [Scutellospora calospora]
MKVALTINICTNDSMVNRAQGTLYEIVYDVTLLIIKNVNDKEEKIIIFNKPPKYIIIEILSQKPNTYDGLLLNYRKQLPITLAFAITKFKYQGATLKKAIVDLDGGNKRVGIYVILSRVQKLEDIMILQPFDWSKLNVTIDSNLKKELKRFEKLLKISYMA